MAEKNSTCGKKKDRWRLELRRPQCRFEELRATVSSPTTHGFLAKNRFEEEEKEEEDEEENMEGFVL